MSARTPAVPSQDLETLVLLRRARDRMDRDFAEGLTVPEVAAGVHLSAAHFSRQFRVAYGETPHSYLMTRRIERAKALLRETSMSVTEVCLSVGASSLGSFSTRFRELVSMTPTQYRAADHSDLEGLPGCVTRAFTRPAR